MSWQKWEPLNKRGEKKTRALQKSVLRACTKPKPQHDVKEILYCKRYHLLCLDLRSLKARGKTCLYSSALKASPFSSWADQIRPISNEKQPPNKTNTKQKNPSLYGKYQNLSFPVWGKTFLTGFGICQRK